MTDYTNLDVLINEWKKGDQEVLIKEAPLYFILCFAVVFLLLSFPSLGFVSEPYKRRFVL